MKKLSLRTAGFTIATGAVLAAGAFTLIQAVPMKTCAALPAQAQASRVQAGPHIDGNHFTLDAAPAADCTAGGNCAVAVKLAATGDYHINQQFPYKFTAAPAAGITYLGSDAQNPQVFSKTAGDFSIDGEKNATMTVKFKAAQKGAVSIAGTFKFSVCSAQNCQLEQQDVAVSVTVK